MESPRPLARQPCAAHPCRWRGRGFVMSPSGDAPMRPHPYRWLHDNSTSKAEGVGGLTRWSCLGGDVVTKVTRTASRSSTPTDSPVQLLAGRVGDGRLELGMRAAPGAQRWPSPWAPGRRGASRRGRRACIGGSGVVLIGDLRGASNATAKRQLAGSRHVRAGVRVPAGTGTHRTRRSRGAWSASPGLASQARRACWTPTRPQGGGTRTTRGRSRPARGLARRPPGRRAARLVPPSTWRRPLRPVAGCQTYTRCPAALRAACAHEPVMLRVRHCRAHASVAIGGNGRNCRGRTSP